MVNGDGAGKFDPRKGWGWSCQFNPHRDQGWDGMGWDENAY